MSQPENEHVLGISHLRDCLGWAYMTIVTTNEPIIIQRYNRQDVVMVPLWEWEFLKEMEANIRAGSGPWEDSPDDGEKSLDVPPRLR